MSTVIESVNNWLERVVIDLNLCPFAKREVRHNRVRMVQSYAADEGRLLEDLAFELSLLASKPTVATTLLIHPQVLSDFADFNQFLDKAESLLEALEYDGEFQLASFHPEYQFAGTHPDAAENYTNKAPYPILHILREETLQQVIEQHPDTEQIPFTNIALMEQMGVTRMQALLKACIVD